MKHYNINTGEVVNFARKPKTERYVALATGGVKYAAHCSAEELIAAGFLPYVEIAAPTGYIPGEPRLTIGADSVVLDYPDHLPDEDEIFNAGMRAIESEYDTKLSAVSSAIVVALAVDGAGMESSLARLRADYQRIQAARNAAIDALWGEE